MKEVIFILTPRLECIYSHISGNIIADIGTDHAYIPIELAKNGCIDHAFACDINTGPCDIARANIENEGFSDIITVRTGGGLSVIAPNEVNQIIIAGMGGKLICDILSADIATALSSPLVLQPMNAQSELRHFLLENGFCITSEDLAVEGFKVYNVLTAEKGTQNPYPTELDYHIPPSLYTHKHIAQLVHKKEREFTKILSGLRLSASDNDTKINEKANYYSELSKALDKLKRQLEILK